MGTFSCLKNTLIPLKYQGPNAHKFGKLAECEGDCYKDRQCAVGLKCFKRTSGKHAHHAVPGCASGGSGDVSKNQYCYNASKMSSNNPFRTAPTLHNGVRVTLLPAPKHDTMKFDAKTAYYVRFPGDTVTKQVHNNGFTFSGWIKQDGKPIDVTQQIFSLRSRERRWS